MASLYTTSQNARKVLTVVLVIIVGILIYDTIGSLQRASIVAPSNERRFYMNPDNKFGIITSPTIPSISLSEGSSPSYSLRQPTFGSFPDVAYVYEIEKPGEKLGTFESIVDKAALLGFPASLLKEEGREMVWTINDDTKTLKFNRDTLVWNLRTSYTNNIEAIRRKVISSQTTTYSRNTLALLRRLVLSVNSYNFGFRDAVESVTIANIGPSGLFFEVDQATQAQYARVDLFRQLPFADPKPQDQQPALNSNERKPVAVTGTVYRDDPRVGIFSAIVSSNLTDYSKDIFEFDFTDFNYTGQTGKYFIIPPGDAWTKVQTGQASLVSLETQEIDRFTPYTSLNIRSFEADPLKTVLAYYEPREWNGYVTPIYVFQGTATLDTGRLANFTFFVNALTERVQ